MAGPEWHLDGWHLNGPADSEGIEIRVDPDGEAGWVGSPPVSGTESPRPARDGSYWGPWTRPRRTIELSGWLWAPTAEARQRAMRRLAAICPRRDQLYELRGVEAGEDLTAQVRLDDEVLITPHDDPSWAEWSIQLAAMDPLLYGTQTYEETVGQLVSGGSGLDWQAGDGLDWATDGGLDWGEPSSTGTLHISNDGTAEIWPLYEFRGPLLNPRIVYDNGRELVYGGEFGSADSLVIDSARRTVHLNGTPRRNLLLRAQWTSIPPGGRDITFRSDTPTSSGTLTVRWRHAYW